MDNVSIVFKGALSSVPSAPLEYIGQYPENTMWGNLSAFGYYLRHVAGITFTNCYSGLASSDARSWVATNDVSSLAIAGPTLNASAAAGNLILHWNNGFTLQRASNATGPYTDLVGATNSYTNALTAPPQQFFRLRQ